MFFEKTQGKIQPSRDALLRRDITGYIQWQRHFSPGSFFKKCDNHLKCYIIRGIRTKPLWVPPPPCCCQIKQLPTCYCKQKLATLAPPPGSSDWFTVLELTLMSGTVCKSWNSFNLTRHLKNVTLMCEVLQKKWDVSAMVIHVWKTLEK